MALVWRGVGCYDSSYSARTYLLIAIFQYVTLYGTAVKVFLSDWEPYLGMYFRDLITLLLFSLLSIELPFFTAQRYQNHVTNNYCPKQLWLGYPRCWNRACSNIDVARWCSNEGT